MAGIKQQTETTQSKALAPSDYVHLHNHTHHSLLDGLTKVNDLVDRVKGLGMNAVAMTDHGTLSGTIEFYKACKEQDIKPIIGIETYVAARTIHDRDPQKDKARYHLILLAMNNTGYQNLMRLSTTANLEGMYYKPRIDHDLLEEYNEGLIALSACAGGEIGEQLRNDNYDGAKRIAQWYQSIFGDRYYFEIQDHEEWDVQQKINGYLFRLSEELGIQCVVTSDAHYVSPKDQEAHEILLCVGTGAYLSDQDRMSLSDFHLHVTDPKEIIERWGEQHPDIITSTRAIAERCNVELDLGKILIPKFPVPEGETEQTYLEKLVYRGLAFRYGGMSETDVREISIDESKAVLAKNVLDRAAYELSVIDSMGFNGYFLIIWDFINWGKNQGIVFGPGRGSAAGSIIAYSLKVTDLDPLKYDLLFERFLNPDRISMPDVDIDIMDSRRDEVIQYCVQKYGKERVANIVTFGKMAARAAVRDVARVLQVPYADADRLAKLIPPPVQGRHIPLKVSVEEDADLKKEYQTNPTAKRVMDFAIRMEGTIRSHGIHAAGVVIAPDEIVKFAPLEMAQKGVVSTQYPMGPIEELGLLKMDFLGLSNLTTIKNALRIVKKVYGDDITLENIPLTDEKTFELFQRGDTTGVFQLESAGMKRYLKELKPTVFEDIIAMVALYRPGPMQFIDSFIKRKHGIEEITYLHPGMENSLKSTYGILVYQEQFMQISKEWCGFTGGQADTLRKAVGKKKIDLMRKVKVDFVEGAISHGGATKEVAEKFWDQLEEFANYCFNKSHAACYGLIAYWTAYLKAHYPDAFMAAVMTSDQDDTDRLAIEIVECKHMGLKVLPPDINQSFVEFSVVPNEQTIRFGMAAVKGVGAGAVEEILRARGEGPFKSVEDFAKRVNCRQVNRRVWEALIKAGGFDEHGDRSDLLFNLDTILAYAQKLQKDLASGQADLFGGLSDAVAMPTIKLDPAPNKHPDKERLTWERELLGLYLSAHPLDKYDDYFTEQTAPIATLKPSLDGHGITVGGVVSSVRQIVTKSGGKMAFVQIEDKSGEGELIVFPKTYEKIGALLKQDEVIKATGKVSSRDKEGNLLDDAKVIVDEITLVTQEELDGYESTGRLMTATREKLPERRRPFGPGAKVAATAPKDETKYIYTPVLDEDAPTPVKTKIYVHVKNPNDHDSLLKLKQTFNKYPGESEIILVLGADKKSAIRLPFRTNPTDELRSDISHLYGEECVAIK
ncbi:DNA polymerase III subunit alpha [Candidatus Saccharibacteria bacterium]|nr:MAG: DNA polymerase III subunit alpha [Candidatus Saccharibacteria bacterium]